MKITIFPGKYHQNGGFSIAILVLRSVTGSKPSLRSVLLVYPAIILASGRQRREPDLLVVGNVWIPNDGKRIPQKRLGGMALQKCWRGVKSCLVLEIGPTENTLSKRKQQKNTESPKLVRRIMVQTSVFGLFEGCRCFVHQFNLTLIFSGSADLFSVRFVLGVLL